MMNLDDMEGMDLESLAHPQPLFAALREAGPAVDMGDMFVVGNTEHVKTVLSNPQIFSSGPDAVDIGQIRPLIPLQIDPPQHKYYRRMTDPIFGRATVEALEPKTRELIRELIGKVKDDGFCNFHETIAEPLPSIVFLQLLGLPVSRTKEFIALKDGIVRPPAKTNEERAAMARATGEKIYEVMQETIALRKADPQDDIITMLLSAEVDGQKLTQEQIEKVGHKNAITRAVGVYERVDVDTLMLEVLPGDSFLLASDGLTGYLETHD